MRKIQTQDVFKLARIIKQAKVKDEISRIIQEASASKEKGNISEKVGIQAFFAIMENCSEPTLEEKIYDLLGGIAGVSPEEFKTQSLDVTLEQIKQIAKENNITDFFKAAGKLQ